MCIFEMAHLWRRITSPSLCSLQLHAEDPEEASSCMQVHSMAQPGNQWIDCRMEEDYAFATVQTLSGHVHRQSVRIVTLPTERAGTQLLTSRMTLTFPSFRRNAATVHSSITCMRHCCEHATLPSSIGCTVINAWMSYHLAVPDTAPCRTVCAEQGC